MEHAFGPSLAALGADDHQKLLSCIQELSYLRDLTGVMEVVRRWARALTGADGVTFVLREKDLVFYADEDAIGPLWKGRRFAARDCISGWAIHHRETVVIEDIYADTRIPVDAYRPTFVKSLLMVPIRVDDPLGAIGSYWAHRHRASAREVALVQALANFTAVAVANAELYRDAQEAIRARDQFLAVAAHELRTPLTALELQLQGACRVVDAQGDATRLATKVRAAARTSHRLTELVERMLDVSRAATGGLVPTLQRQPLDLAAVASEVVERFRDAGMSGRSTVVVHAPAPVVGSWDAVRIEQVVTNLVSNACKFGDGKPIQVAVEAKGARARLTVRDEGIGISPADQKRMFQLYERAVSPEHYGGLGLGLFITRRLVEAHGGSVELASEPGRGTTVAVELPI